MYYDFFEEHKKKSTSLSDEHHSPVAFFNGI